MYNKAKLELTTTLLSQVAGFLLAAIAAPALANIPAGFSGVDVGNTGAAGSSAASNGVITIRGSGGDIWGNSDGFHFLQRQVTGDAQLTAYISSVSNTDSWTKAGLMVRRDLTQGAVHAMALLRPVDGAGYQFRVTSAGQAQFTTNNGMLEHIYAPKGKWLRLRKEGNRITTYVSDDGACWQERMKQELPNLGASAHFGIALTSHNYGTLATAKVTDLALITSPLPPVNSLCPELMHDGLLPEPTSWIEPPGKAGGASWFYTTTNPNESSSINDERCDPDSQDDLTNDKPAERRDSPDHPKCLVNTGPLNWTQAGYTGENNWLSGTVGFGEQPKEGDVINTAWTGSSIWLRKRFMLTNQQQIDDLMFWGRWSNGITVYINGVLATHSEVESAKYRYLGMKNNARSTLRVGENVVAIRVEAFEWYVDSNDVVRKRNHGHNYFDFGITTMGALARSPRTALVASGKSHIQSFAERTKEYMQEQGIPGATLAISDKNNVLAGSWVFGYEDPSLTTSMPTNAVLRLASNDKVLTRAIIVHLIEQAKLDPNGLKPGSRYFEFLEDNLGINLELPPGKAAGANMDNVTIEHLIQHEGGIPEVPREHIDRIAFAFKLAPDELLSQHLVQWIYSLDTNIVPGSDEQYSSNGHFLLRFLASEILAAQGKTLEQFLANDMGLNKNGIPDVLVAHHRELNRSAREPGYYLVDPIHDRHVFMENYFALAASPGAFAEFAKRFSIDYELTNGTYEGHGASHGGAMDGAISLMLHDRVKNRSLMLNTTMWGNFDELTEYLGRQFWAPECSWGNFDSALISSGSVTGFLQSVWKPEQYLNRETGLKASPIASRDWVSARWKVTYIDTISGKKRYTIANEWNGTNFLYKDVVNGQTVLKAGTPASAVPASARYWYIESVSAEHALKYRIYNAHDTSYYLATESQSDDNPNFTSTHEVSLRNNHQNTWLSSQWGFCKL